MVFTVYILSSETTSVYYVGHTDDLPRRTAQHNDPEYHGSKHTKRNKGPWICVYTEQYDTRAEAMKREREIKAKKSRKYIEFLIYSWQSPSSWRESLPGANKEKVCRDASLFCCVFEPCYSLQPL